MRATIPPARAIVKLAHAQCVCYRARMVHDLAFLAVGILVGAVAVMVLWVAALDREWKDGR